MSDGDDTADYAWLVGRRTKIQELLFDVYNTLRERRGALDANGELGAVFALIVGAAFSLWRAVFLIVDARRDEERPLDAAERFLRTLVVDNSILYRDERNTNAWTAGYYLNNATFRMRRIIEKLEQARVSPDARHAGALARVRTLLAEGISKRPTLTEELDTVYEGVRSALAAIDSAIEKSPGTARVRRRAQGGRGTKRRTLAADRRR